MKHFLLVTLSFACLALALTASPIEQKDAAGALCRIQRVYVEQLGGGKASDQMRDMLIAALQNSGLFAITETLERADAVIRGSADDVTYTEEHHTSESLGAHVQAGSGVSKNSRQYAGGGLTENESSQSKERRHEASAAIRIVGANGDVLWSTTQESGGGRFRGALADVADKIVRRLTDDIEKAKKLAPSPSQ